MAIFEQIGKRLSSAGQGAAQQAKNFADVARLNSAISEREKRIAQLYTELGRLYYEQHKDDSQAVFVPQIPSFSKKIYKSMNFLNSGRMPMPSG